MTNLFAASIVLYMIGALVAHADEKASRWLCFVGALATVITGFMMMMRLG